jgi:glycosyltransferase involved in cell wall biosynthesis
MKISIIVPAFNEEENIPRTTERLVEMIGRAGLDAEVVLVDDGSGDGTWKRALEAAEKHGERVRAVRLRRNRGKTAAIVRGIEAAAGDAFVVFDADMQFSPDDIPRMVRELEDGADVVTAWKQGKYQKWLVSSIYNVLSRRLFGLDVHDLNSMKAFRRDVVRGMNLRKGWHRYMVALAADQGFEIREIRVELHPRRYGETKYGVWRIPVGFLDLIAVKFQISFMRKPLLLFGSVGMILFGGGFLVGVYALYLRFVLNHGYRPLAYLVTLLVISGLVLFAVGFLAEVMADIKGRVERIEERIERREGDA